jgi:hypothetical protein
MINESQDRFLQGFQALEMVRLQQLPLQDAEPDLDLIEQEALVGNQKTWTLNAQPWASHCSCSHCSSCLGAWVAPLSRIKAMVCSALHAARPRG